MNSFLPCAHWQQGTRPTQSVRRAALRSANSHQPSCRCANSSPNLSAGKLKLNDLRLSGGPPGPFPMIYVIIWPLWLPTPNSCMTHLKLDPIEMTYIGKYNEPPNR